MSLRKKLNKYLEPRGYRIEKIDRFKEVLFAEYEKTDDFCFVQIGANDGVQFDGLYQFVTSRRCRGVVVEPIKIYFDRLRKNYEKYPSIIPVNCAIHATDKYATLYYVDPNKLDQMPEWAEGIGSLNPEHHKKSNTPQEYIVSEEVECMNIMNLFEMYDLDKVNLLQIDAEGYDGEIIKMIDFSKNTPRIIKYEHASLEASEQEEIRKLLESQNYELFSHRIDTVAVHV